LPSFEKGSDSDLLREMISFVAQRLMDYEVEAVCNAKPYERRADRANSRNGSATACGRPTPARSS